MQRCMHGPAFVWVVSPLLGSSTDHESWETYFLFFLFFYRKYWLNLTLSIWHVQVIINEYLTCNNSLIIKPEFWSDYHVCAGLTVQMSSVQLASYCQSNRLSAADPIYYTPPVAPRKTQLEGALESISTLLHLIVSTKYNYNTPLLTSKLKSKPRLDP